FTPDAATLDRVVASLEERGDGVAAEPALRREALARYDELPAPGARPSRGWKYDYAKLKFEELRWTSGRVAMPALPPRPIPPKRTADAADIDVDRPALATDNAGGLFFIGATHVDAPSNADPRITVRA